MFRFLKTHQRLWIILGTVVGMIAILFFLVAYFSAKWYVTTYGQVGFDSILFTLGAGLTGTDKSLVRSYLFTVIPKTLGCGALAYFLFFFPAKKSLAVTLFKKLRICFYPLPRILRCVLPILLCISLLLGAVKLSEADAYFLKMVIPTNIYETDYRNPATTPITFPEEKRNLIYIYLESMETTFLSTEQGGVLETSPISELYNLAQNNINFSHNADVGGFTVAAGATWTIGAMVGQTAGIPLKIPYGVDSNSYGADGNFLSGVTSLNDILHENGYYQALMVGSDANFGSRKQYYTAHGVDRVYDLFTARADGLIPEDYYEWWGFEDHYLYTYAKQVITEMSQKDQPFAFTMLTVDTHHVGGYKCDYCRKDFNRKYENVMQCASRQVDAFIRWLQEQPFYENTTVVIVGDHPTMDKRYISKVTPEGYSRRVYNCFINSAVSTPNTKIRQFCTYDMFPSTLAAMGCTIEGDRLGLGTNLFSDIPTLLEATNGEVMIEFERNSQYYNDHFYN